MVSQEKRSGKISKKVSKKSNNTFNVNIGLIVPVLQTSTNSISFVSNHDTDFVYPRITVNKNINESIIDYVDGFMELSDKRSINPQIFYVDQTENEVNILYIIRVYPDTKIKTFHLIPYKNILQYEYIQKALQLF